MRRALRRKPAWSSTMRTVAGMRIRLSGVRGVATIRVATPTIFLMERRCLWLSEVPSEALPAMSGSLAADVCIVGGGYTGLWTALRVLELEPAASVVVVEARFCGAGASGRNGGFALSWWSKLPALIARCG